MCDVAGLLPFPLPLCSRASHHASSRNSQPSPTSLVTTFALSSRGQRADGGESTSTHGDSGAGIAPPEKSKRRKRGAESDSECTSLWSRHWSEQEGEEAQESLGGACAGDHLDEQTRAESRCCTASTRCSGCWGGWEVMMPSFARAGCQRTLKLCLAGHAGERRSRCDFVHLVCILLCVDANPLDSPDPARCRCDIARQALDAL
jgi:hypothetical protein